MFKRTKFSTCALLALGGATLLPASMVFAQETQRVEITGSLIKRLGAETALPVTVIKIEELTSQGVTTAEQAMQRIAANQSNFGASQSVGATTGGKSEADLRGLGAPTGTNANKTLVLLNGKRLANHAFDAAAVDLNSIPLAAVDRIEVLRDGASAIYGTDAIGGVINFILRRSFKGIELSAQNQTPEASGGGRTNRANIVAGFGSLTEDRFNVYGTLDVRNQTALLASDRKFGSTGILGTSRGAITAGTSGTAFPGDLDGFEPSGPNCAPPFSVPRNANPDNTGAFGSCREDFTRFIDLIPKNKQITGLLRGAFALSPDNTLSAEYLRSNNKAISRVAPAPTSNLILASSPFFPTGAPTQDIDGLIPFFDLTDPNPSGPTLGGVANWRQVPAGKRTSGDDTTTTRAMIGLEGSAASFDYSGSIGRSKNNSIATVKRGYVNDGLIQQGVWDGVINPFGDQSAAGQAAIDAAQVVADTVIGTARVDFVEGRVSTELFKTSAGTVSAAFGFDHRREKSSFENTDITAQLGSLGVDPNGDTSGSRNSSAVFAEFSVPLLKALELTVAGRFDRYSDTGNTFNPKIGLRFQPFEELVLRGSYNTGFRAPTLYEIHQPRSLTFTSDNYDDPLLCPDGVPAVGTSAGVVCGQQVLQRTSGPVAIGRPSSDLSPERSRSVNFGLRLEPMRQFTVGFDLWQIKLRNLINGLPEQAIFGDPTKFADRFVRCSTVAAGDVPGVSLTDIDACTSLTATQDPIAFIDTPVENLGKLQTRGVDLTASWHSGSTAFGSFGLNFDGTYVDQFKYQREKGGEFIKAVGRYTDNAPVFRWQHVITGNWSMGSWGATLAQRFKSHYVDQDPSNTVGSYLVHDISVSYTLFKSLTLLAGVNNVFDKSPPLSLQSTTFQRGFDPRFTDPIGRAFQFRASYKY